MNISIVYPFIYLALGIFISKAGLDDKYNIKGYVSALLMRLFIPAVIIYNIAYHEPGVFMIMIATALIMFIMLYIGLKIYKDPVVALCYSFINIGWFGLPITMALYGDHGAMAIIPAYVATSILGNAVGAGVLHHEKGIWIKIHKIIVSFPFIAFVIGLACSPFVGSIQYLFETPYHYAKLGTSFFGMLILGIWIGKTKLSEYKFKQGILLTLNRIIVFSLLMSFLIALGFFLKVHLITSNIKVLYLIGLLPPAANIIVLETYHLERGHSAPIIATGTLISIVLVLVYAMAVLYV
ncbi:hypothetical protein HK18_01680 [Commensalibacter intestini]|uniref:Permease n=1 Tax=Commensalibacter intestini TaxID=479936 RepID=A0A251ZXD4_9PROT|nr:hypothetical protein [Commensalibacter intestini]OUI79302.1 hypothetical protein HK18_01680 [Commensalibacter intestini]